MPLQHPARVELLGAILAREHVRGGRVLRRRHGHRRAGVGLELFRVRLSSSTGGEGVGGGRVAAAAAPETHHAAVEARELAGWRDILARRRKGT